jgi:hypothetical protein
VRSAPSIVVFALAENALGYVVFGTVALSLVMSVLLLFTRGSSDSMYDQIGRGGISREGDYGGGAPRSERLVRSGQPALDVETELARLLASEQAPAARDAGLVAEVRQLVVARNERRVRQGHDELEP